MMVLEWPEVHSDVNFVCHSRAITSKVFSMLDLAVFAALNSVLSLAYYTPLVNAIYRREQSKAVINGGLLPKVMSLPLIGLAGAVIMVGLWPGLMNWLTAFAVRFTPRSLVTRLGYKLMEPAKS